MNQLFKITHIVNDSVRIVAVEAHDADEAQERFINHCEAQGAVHGVITSIRIAA